MQMRQRGTNVLLLPKLLLCEDARKAQPQPELGHTHRHRHTHSSAQIHDVTHTRDRWKCQRVKDRVVIIHKPRRSKDNVIDNKYDNFLQAIFNQMSSCLWWDSRHSKHTPEQCLGSKTACSKLSCTWCRCICFNASHPVPYHKSTITYVLHIHIIKINLINIYGCLHSIVESACTEAFNV